MSIQWSNMTIKKNEVLYAAIWLNLENILSEKSVTRDNILYDTIYTK